MLICRENSCDQRVEFVADRDAESVVWNTNKMLNVFFPSVPAGHGRCSYHQRKIDYAALHEYYMEERRKRNKNIQKTTRQLFKMGGSTYGDEAPDYQS